MRSPVVDALALFPEGVAKRDVNFSLFSRKLIRWWKRGGPFKPSWSGCGPFPAGIGVAHHSLLKVRLERAQRRGSLRLMAGCPQI